MMDVPMPRSLTVALAALMILTSCGTMKESRLNPFNWFGRSEQTETVAAVGANEDPRPLVDEVISMQIEPYSTGVIVRATGITPTQGWWNAELVEANLEEKDPSHLVLEFRLLPPPATTPVNTPRSREVTVAKTVSVNRLENIRQITVQGARNARTSRATR